MKTYIKLLIFIQILFSALPSQAIQMKSLYQTDVIVASQEESVRKAGLKVALQAVLIKISGNAQIVHDALIQKKLDEALSLVNEYGYQSFSGSGSDEELHLWVNFDPEGVDAVLEEAGIPLWGEDRPLIVPWLVSELPADKTHILTEEQDPVWVGAFNQAAKQRGLPMIFPLMDLRDLASVGPESILTGNHTALLQAAKRYNSNAVLMGQIVSISGECHMTVTLWLAGDHWRWELSGNNPEGLAFALTDRVAGILSARSVAVSEEPSEIQLTVDGIQGAGEMTALTGYLQHLSSVLSVDVQQVLGGRVILALRVRGGMSSFTHEIAGSSRLVADLRQSLHYQWMG